jgi:DNA-directed RNA polymerase subunit RPC12/RpoP
MAFVACIASERETMPSRTYHCTHCGKALQASPKAFSVNCRYCNQRVSLEDYRIDAHHAITNIETSGTLSVAPSGHVRAKIRVENLDVQGQLYGNVSVNDKVSIDSNAHLIGNVSAKKLEVKSGAVLHGYFTIGQESPK